MTNKEKIISLLKEVKKTEKEIIFFDDKGQKMGQLKPVVESSEDIVVFLSRLREYYKDKFFTQFTVTQKRTKKWLDEQMIKREDRILFLVMVGGKMIGHVDVTFFKEGDVICELGNIAKDSNCNIFGVMTFAIKSLIEWLFSYLKMEEIKLRVFSSNIRAQALYIRCGFKKTREIALTKKNTQDEVSYVPVEENGSIDATMIEFVLKKSAF